MLDLTRDAAIELRRVERLDSGNAVAHFKQRLPGLFGGVSDGGQQTNAGDYNSAGNNFLLLRLAIRGSCGPSVRTEADLLLLAFDVGDGVPYGCDLLGVFVRNFQFEGLFEGHHEFHDVERIGAQVVDERSLVIHLAFVHSQLLDNYLFDLLFYRRCHNFLHYILGVTDVAQRCDSTLWCIPLALKVVLVSTRNPLNIGAAARAVANFGFDELRLVDPYDVAFREAVSAVGGAHVLQNARVFPTVAEAVADCTLVVGTTAAQHRVPQQPVERLDAGMKCVRDYDGRVGLLFGSEKFGLSNDDMSFCHSLIRIPTVPGTPSMNLGQAVAVCLYEIVRENLEPTPTRFDPVPGTDAEQMTRMLLEVLEESGYTNRITSVSTEQKIRRWVRRLRIGRRDAPLLLGILRQILWKFREK